MVPCLLELDDARVFELIYQADAVRSDESDPEDRRFTLLADWTERHRQTAAPLIFDRADLADDARSLLVDLVVSGRSDPMSVATRRTAQVPPPRSRVSARRDYLDTTGNRGPSSTGPVQQLAALEQVPRVPKLPSVPSCPELPGEGPPAPPFPAAPPSYDTFPDTSIVEL